MNKILKGVIKFNENEINGIKSAIKMDDKMININKEIDFTDNEHTYSFNFQILGKIKNPDIEIRSFIEVNGTERYYMDTIFIKKKQKYYESFFGVRKYTLNLSNKIDFYINFKLDSTGLSINYLRKNQYEIFSKNIYLLNKNEKEENYILNEIAYREFDNEEELADACLLMINLIFYGLLYASKDVVELFIKKLYYIGIDIEDYGDYLRYDGREICIKLESSSTSMSSKIDVILELISLIIRDKVYSSVGNMEQIRDFAEKGLINA